MPGYRLDRSPTHLLRRAEQRAEEISLYYGVMRELTPRQLAVLVTIAENEGLDQMGATRLTGIDRTMTDLVRRLMRKGPPAAPAQPIGPSGLCPEADRGRPAGAARRRPIASSIDAW